MTFFAFPCQDVCGEMQNKGLTFSGSLLHHTKLRRANSSVLKTDTRSETKVKNIFQSAGWGQSLDTAEARWVIGDNKTNHQTDLQDSNILILASRLPEDRCHDETERFHLYL